MARSANGPLKSRTVTIKTDDAFDIAMLDKVTAMAKTNRRTESDQILMDLATLAQYKPDSAAE